MGEHPNGGASYAQDSLVEIEDEGGCEAVGRAKGVCPAVITHGDAAPVLDATEHDLDFLALFVQGFAVARFFLAVPAWWKVGLPPTAVQNERAAESAGENLHPGVLLLAETPTRTGTLTRHQREVL